MRAAGAVAGAFVGAILVALVVWRSSGGSGSGSEGGGKEQGSWGQWVAKADSVLAPKGRKPRYPPYAPGRAPRVARQVIELNTADSAALVAVYGIGPVFAARILAHRSALGGFYRIEQLREVRGISETLFLQIEKSFRVDVARIKQINVNFVAPRALEAHPYVTANMAQRLVEGKLKGGYYNKVEDLLNRDILLPGEAKKLAPYLLFTQNESKN